VPPPPPPPPPPPAPVAPPAGPAYYLAPGGSDAADGRTPDTAWRTFDRAIPALAPGDTLVLLDGRYERGTTGLAAIDCRDGGNARSGSAAAPITVRAANERRAFLASDGTEAALGLYGCAWWRVEGLRLASRDDPRAGQAGGYPLRVDDVEHVELRRLLGSHNNRMENTHVFAIENSRHVLLEECEAYFFHRHAFSVWRSRWVTIRRCYANSMQRAAHGCCSDIDNRGHGDEAFSLYGTSDSVVENSVSENQANGFQIHGIASPLDPSGHGGRRNRVLGCMSLGDAVAALVSSRVVGAYHNARDNEFRDFVAAGTSGNGLYLRGVAGTLIDRATLVGSTGSSGLVADSGDAGYGGTCGGGNPDGCSFQATDVLALDNARAGVAVSGTSDWTIDGINAAGNGVDFHADGSRIGRAESRPDPSVGVGPGRCVLWARPDSAAKGAGRDGGDLGATVARRYQDGVLTDAPLWDPATGAFPCGAVVAGVNDGDLACANLHARLGVGDPDRCPMP
jgi:hypothetical protein